MDPVTVLMQPLLQQARAEGKWLWTRYHDIWFSPDELESEQRKGNFRWGPVNWELRDPREYVEASKRSLDAARQEHERRMSKVANSCALPLHNR